MNKDKKVINAYVKAVLKEMNCSKAVSSVFRKKFLSEISDFAKENEGISYEAIVSRFGEPAEIAAGFFERSDYEELLKLARKKVRIWKWIGIIAAVFALIAILFCIKMHLHLGGTVDVTDSIIDN